MEKGALTIEKVEMETNGDKYWLHFDAKESINRCREYERRGTDFKVQSGLELYLAKLSLKHSVWYAYLKTAEIYPTTSTRRMRIADNFLVYLGLLHPGEKVALSHIYDALETIEVKPCILHDFACSIKLDEVRFHKEMPPDARQQMGVKITNKDEMFGVNPARLVKFIRGNWNNWNASEQADAILFIQNVITMCKGLMHEFKEEHPIPQLQERIKDLNAERARDEGLLDSLNEIKPQDWELEEPPTDIKI